MIHHVKHGNILRRKIGIRNEVNNMDKKEIALELTRIYVKHASQFKSFQEKEIFEIFIDYLKMLSEV